MKQKEANKEEKVKINEELKNEKLSLEKQKNLKEERNTYKQLSPEISKKLFINIILAVGIIAYFTILNYIYAEKKKKTILNIVEICSGVLLLISLILLEVSYKRDSGTIAILGIEFLVLAFHSLSIKYVITKYDYQFQFYLLTSSYIFAIYYILKAIVVYTKARNEYLKTLSDIPEIVKKEAKKRNNEEVKNNKIDKTQQKPKTIRKRGTRKKKVEESGTENKEKNNQNKTKKNSEKTKTEVKKTKSTTSKKDKENAVDATKIKTKKKSSKKEEEK